MKNRILFLVIVLLLGIYSCATTRYVAEYERLLTEVKIEGDSLDLTKNIDYEAMKSFLAQRPNKRLFGVIPWNLTLYNMSNIKSQSWLNRLLRRWGEEPVIYNQEETEYTAKKLATVLYNQGFLHANAKVKLDTLTPKKIGLTYTLQAGDLYEISQHKEFFKDKHIDSLLHPIDSAKTKKKFPNELYTSYLRSGTPLSSDNMQRERHRISRILRNRGYYDFKDENIYFRVDTNKFIKDVWVHTVLDSCYQQYRIGKISVWQNMEPHNPAFKEESKSGILFYRKQKRWLHPNILAKRIFLHKGAIYSSELNRQTYSALMDLQSNSSVSIKYSKDTTSSKPILNCDIITTIDPNKEFMLELVGTHSDGNLGANTAFGIKHNNLFHGSEELSLLFRIGYENLSDNTQDHLNYGFETSLSLPRVILPILYKSKDIRSKASTDLNFIFDSQYRPEFSRKLFSFNWGYSWSLFQKPKLRHKLKLAEIDYMRFDYINKEFYTAMPDITRMLYYRNQFVLGSSYTLNYSSLGGKSPRYARNIHNIRLHLQAAGNILRSISKLINSPQDRYGAYALMNINYAQFIRSELNYSGLYRLNKRNTLATHFATQVVYPYGNSRILPIDLRYFSGGANSMRGWGVRSLGPGSMTKKENNNIFFQSGDIKLDMTLEHRKRISPSFEFATFLDAGNIWTIYPYKAQENGDFSFHRFYKEIALSTGFGLRWDFNYFLLRLDMGIKLYDPQEPMNRRWVFGDKSLSELCAFHFALGYPF